MKKFLIVFIMILMMGVTTGHSKSMKNLVDILDIDWGAYSSVGLDFGAVGSQYPTFLNWRAVIMMNHFFVLGVSGRNLLGQYTMPQQTGGENAFLKNSYLGFTMGIHYFSYSPIHFSTSMTVGSGRIGYNTVSGAESTENFFVMIPEIAIEIRLVEFIQFAIEGRYPLYFNFNDLLGVGLNDINGFYWGVSVRFGSF